MNHQETLYLVSPFIDGESLKARLARGPLSLTATLAMLEPLCSALQAAAEQDLAHGALHPSNVFFPTEGGVLLSDFGMAELRVSAGAKWDGLLSYVAPESLETGAAPATVRADVFSLGVLVYECLIGQPMFDAKSLASYLAMVGTPPKMTVKHPSYAHLDAVLGWRRRPIRRRGLRRCKPCGGRSNRRCSTFPRAWPTT
ncbi:MAG: protein kinase [Polyangia bacterium]